MIKTVFEDGEGSGSKAGVTVDNEVKVIVSPYPPLDDQKVLPFRQYLTDDGLQAGNNVMAANGSTTNIDYFIEADDNSDIYITSLNFIIAYGATGQPNEWADGTALSNGSRLFYETATGEHDIHEAIKTNQDFFRLSFSPIPTAWEVRHVNALNDYGYFISMDLTRLGLPYGIRIDHGTNQRLILRVRDDTSTDADTFNCIAYGFKRLK